MNIRDLIPIIYKRQEKLEISLEDINSLLNISNKNIENILNSSKSINLLNLLGLDRLGNETIDIQALKEKRAEKKALQIVSLVQDTSSLENQGLEQKDIKKLLEETKEQFLTGEYKKNLWKV